MLRLKFETSEIENLEQGYLRQSAGIGDSEQADKRAKDAGARIRQGYRTKENLYLIFYWKHQSSRFRERLINAFNSNSCDTVTAILNQVHEIVEVLDDAGCAVTELVGLKGVGVPTASAFLANIYPEKFTLIDILALRALGIDNQEIAFYRYYNDECRRLAKESSTSMRTLDRALWQWGKTNPPRRTGR